MTVFRSTEVGLHLPKHNHLSNYLAMKMWTPIHLFAFHLSLSLLGWEMREYYNVHCVKNFLACPYPEVEYHGLNTDCQWMFGMNLIKNDRKRKNSIQNRRWGDSKRLVCQKRPIFTLSSSMVYLFCCYPSHILSSQPLSFQFNSHVWHREFWNWYLWSHIYPIFLDWNDNYLQKYTCPLA